MQACSSDAPDEMPEYDFDFSPRVTACLADHVYARSYQEEGDVVTGKYYLSYPANNDTKEYTVAIVDFDRQDAETPGLGIVNTLDGPELKWSDVYGSPVTFYLDNVPQTYGTGAIVEFTEGDNPFVAGIFDNKEGTNDLLWGEKSVNSGTRSLGFDLHHNMSRVRVQVEVRHEDNSVEEITLEGASVKITNLYAESSSYNRLDGTLALKEDGPYEVQIVKPGVTGYDWVSETEDTEEGKTVYMSPDIILPPQSIAEDAMRSRLEITLKNGTVYSGILPHAMLIAASPGSELTYPVTLAFLKEYVMTIHTVITEEPPELAFMPVWVADWVDKGEFTLEGHQSGVYTTNEFYRLIQYYKDNNEYQLVRYGYLFTPKDSSDDTQEWNFDFWSSVTLNFSDIAGKMTPGTVVADKGTTKNFTFSFHNYGVFVYNGDESTAVKVTESQLYQIVTGKLSWTQLTNR